MKKFNMLAICTICTLTTASLLGFGGKGWNECEKRYQWDSGFHASIASISSTTLDANLNPHPTKYVGAVQVAFPPGADISRENAGSNAQGFDTRHRGKYVDEIAAIQLGIPDYEEFLAGLAAAYGEGSQGITSVSLSLVGKKITLAIWETGFNSYDGKQFNQTRANAKFTMDYIVTEEDIGIKNAHRYKIHCPFYVVTKPVIFSGLLPNSKILPCHRHQDVRVGDGQNVRPLKFFAESMTNFLDPVHPKPPISSTHPDHRHISRAGNFINQTGVCGEKPHPTAEYPIPYTQAPFSQYKTHYTTIRLKDSFGTDTTVEVSGEFWVGLLVDLDREDVKKTSKKGYFVPGHHTHYDYYGHNGHYLGPQKNVGGKVNGWDDIGYSVLGVSVVDISAPGPGGISYANMTTGGYIDPNGTVTVPVTPLANNQLAPNTFDINAVMGGFNPANYTAVAIGPSNVGNYLDEFYTIRAIPADSTNWLP